MLKTRIVKIDGREYSLYDVLYNKAYKKKIEKALTNNQKDLIELFRALEEGDLERERAPKEFRERSWKMTDCLLSEYGEFIKASISSDRLIDAADKANFRDFFRVLISAPLYRGRKTKGKYRKNN